MHFVFCYINIVRLTDTHTHKSLKEAIICAIHLLVPLYSFVYIFIFYPHTFLCFCMSFFLDFMRLIGKSSHHQQQTKFLVIFVLSE